jgi:hypothetical protein
MLVKLKAKKIVWNSSFDDPNSQVFIMFIDGMDFKVWGEKHSTLLIDIGQYSHKFNHQAVKYEMTIDIYGSKVVWIKGPHRAHSKCFMEVISGVK